MQRSTCKQVLVLCFVAAIAMMSSQRLDATLYPGDKLTVSGTNCHYSPNGLRALCVGIPPVGGGLKYVLYWNENSFPSWYSDADANWPGPGTHTGHSMDATSNASAEMQSDGNFVLYTGPGGSAVWSTNTSGHTNNPVFEPQDDGNLVLYENGLPIWALF